MLPLLVACASFLATINAQYTNILEFPEYGTLPRCAQCCLQCEEGPGQLNLGFLGNVGCRTWQCACVKLPGSNYVSMCAVSNCFTEGADVASSIATSAMSVATAFCGQLTGGSPITSTTTPPTTPSTTPSTAPPTTTTPSSTSPSLTTTSRSDATVTSSVETNGHSITVTSASTGLSQPISTGTADSSKQGGGRLSEADIIGLAVSIPILLLAAVIIWASVYGARKLKDKRKLEKEGRHERVPLQDWGYI